ncbi:chromosome segregation protein SMC [Aquiluna sp.]|nr:chromosome segregation protein SMC [Aquiluna sp.]
MHLKSITLKGFKSFARAAHLPLEPGITCVVGPNGSGKSNIIDALAWVMGEQGPKTLRSGKMEDVIFAGTNSIGPLGRAEAHLTFDNTDGVLPIEFAEVTISRVLFRNGSSEYSINGEGCRLLDLQEMLNGTGLGREMHVIVGQGQLDSLLKATPLERRALIEEASGVLKYRRRREKTERKLEAMHANLIRLQDLIAEVKRNLRPLGRQAETAQQAKEIAAGIRDAKTQLLSLQLTSLKEKLELASEEESRRKSEASMIQSQLDTSRQAVAALESELNQALPDAARSRLFTLESLETSIRSSRSVATQKINLAMDSSVNFQMEQLDSLQRGLKDIQNGKEKLIGLVQAANESLAEASKTKAAAVSQLDEFDSEVEALRLQAEAYKSVLAKRESHKEALEQAVKVSKDTLSSQRGQLENISVELKKLQAMRTASDTNASSASAELRARYEESRKKEIGARASIDKAREELHKLEKKRDYLAARHAALGQVLENPDGSGNILRAKLPGIERLLADAIKVKPGYEKAVAAALGSLANSVLVVNQQAAIAALNHLRQNDLGRAEFIVSGRLSKAEVNNSQATALLSVVEVPGELQGRLESFVVAKDLSEAEQFLKKDKTATVVTLDGDYLSAHLVKGGGASEPSKVELISERARISEELFTIGKQIETAGFSLDSLKSAHEALSEEVTANLNELQQQDAESATKAEAYGRLIAQIEGAQAEKTRLEVSIAQLTQKLRIDSEELSAVANELDDKEQPALPIDPEAGTELAEKVEVARESETQAQIELGAMRERLAAAERDEAALDQRLQLAKREKADWEQKQLLQGAETEKARRVLATCEPLMPLMERLVSAARKELRELESSRQQKATRVTELRAQITAMESRSLELSRRVQEAEMKTYELKLQQQSINEKIFDELSLTPEELLEDARDAKDSEARSEEELRKAIRTAESRLSQLGAFNPLALEEFSALEERHKYLTEQLADLNSARADLKGIIKDLDEKMNTTFLSAFEDTKKAFEEIFPVLFPGGTGSISLTEPEEGQEAGVEVSVRPAGKRIERMSLLSGGERSLAAIALLIAIFKARPSPFYVLDEVEAALDDANLGRLLEVLETLRETSQLIIVTHQKRTMEIADALYGVSMGKDGITRVVGQKLDKAS